MKTNLIRSFFLAMGLLVPVVVWSAAATLQAPRSVASALRVLNQVVGHTGRLVAAKDYKNVSHEHPEFTEGAAMLREALRGEPADFTTKAESALTAAVDASAALGKISETADDAKISAAHVDFAAKVKAVIELFPEDVRPKPRQRS